MVVAFDWDVEEGDLLQGVVPWMEYVFVVEFFKE